MDDDRESPSYVLMTLLKERGAEVSYYDPYVPVIKPTREHPQWAGVKSVPWNEKTIKAFDLVLIATKHNSRGLPAVGPVGRLHCGLPQRHGRRQDQTRPGLEGLISETKEQA